jgi:hypothetical protein
MLGEPVGEKCSGEKGEEHQRSNTSVLVGLHRGRPRGQLDVLSPCQGRMIESISLEDRINDVSYRNCAPRHLVFRGARLRGLRRGYSGDGVQRWRHSDNAVSHVYQVDGGDTVDTRLWLSAEDVLICDDVMINKDEQGEKASVTLLH